MATTVLDVITKAMQIIGALSIGQSPSSDDATLGLNDLNAMLDGWNSERLNLYTVATFTGNLTNAKQSYAMGPAATDFNTNSPILIQTASVIIPGSTVRRAVTILSATEFANLTEKGLTGFLPDKLYCDYQFPIANLLVHPIPNQTIALELYLWSVLAQFVNLTDAVSLRPAYLEAIQYNLAVKLAPQFGLAQDQTNVQLAGTYKQEMQRLNAMSAFPIPPHEQMIPPSSAQAPAQ